MDNNSLSTRRYDLDWLRIIAFGFLILYHVGMFFDLEIWHVNSIYTHGDWRLAMNLLNPWRLPLLFFISGVAIKFASDKYSHEILVFTKARFNRLIIPLLFGIAFIVAPQTYYELLLTRHLIEPGFFNFFMDYISFDQKWPEVITPTYNHLWYVLYMLIYSLIYLSIKKYTDKIKAPNFLLKLLKTPLFLIIPILPFVFYRFTTDIAFPENHDITTGDWGAQVRYGSYFMFGILIAKSQTFWSSIKQYWKPALVLSLLSILALPNLWENFDTYQEDGIAMNLIRSLRIFYIWWVFAAFFGFAQCYLNRPSKSLTYLTEAIFPYYILHQTITVVAGAFITPYAIGLYPEFAFVFGSTVIGCLVLHEYVIRRTKFLRPLFGLK